MFPKRIVIVDDHPLISEGVKSVLVSSGWDAEILIFDNSRAFLEDLAQHSADLYLMDIQLGESDGRKLIKQIKELAFGAKVVVLSSFDDDEIIRSSFKSGADAYMIKSVSFQEMVQALKAIWQNEKVHLAQVKYAHDDIMNGSAARVSVPRLTQREKDILKLILEEKTTKEIAQALCLSEKTIEAHRSNLFIKLEVKNIAGLVKKALSWGIE